MTRPFNTRSRGTVSPRRCPRRRAADPWSSGDRIHCLHRRTRI